jgi:hypothetical protein
MDMFDFHSMCLSGELDEGEEIFLNNTWTMRLLTHLDSWYRDSQLCSP